MRAPSGDDGASDGDSGHAAFAKGLDEVVGDGFCEQTRLLRPWAVEKRAVFGDDPLEEVDAGEDFKELREFAAGDEEEFASGFLEFFEGFDGGVGDAAVGGEGAVVVRGQGEEVHGCSG